MHFCNWSLGAVYDGVLDPKFIQFTDKAWSRLSKTMLKTERIGATLTRHRILQ
jgi:hypothetical protein